VSAGSGARTRRIAPAGHRFRRRYVHRSIALAVLALAATTASAQTSVGVSIGISQPGVYGRIDIGNHPPPPVLYPQPVIIVPGPVSHYQRPIYLHVPPGHAKNWSKHCNRYAACGQPVYFVQETWLVQQGAHGGPGYRSPAQPGKPAKQGKKKDR
jgi:hypothetical protein